MIDLSYRKTNYTDTTESDITDDMPIKILNDIRVKNPNRIIMAHLNINSLRNKCEGLKSLVKDKVDILCITESKLDKSFPKGQFEMAGYKSPIRLDRDKSGGGLIIYIREDIPAKTLESLPSDRDNEGIFIEINLRNNKWLLFCGYNPKKERISEYISNLSNRLNKHRGNYDNIIILGDLNCDYNIKDNKLYEFSEVYNLKNIVKGNTCFKNTNHPTSIDVILTNRKERFQDTKIIETGLSDYHKMTITCLRRYVKKNPPIVINYRNYKNFDALYFQENLSKELGDINKQHVTYDEVKN